MQQKTCLGGASEQTARFAAHLADTQPRPSPTLRWRWAAAQTCLRFYLFSRDRWQACEGQPFEHLADVLRAAPMYAAAMARGLVDELAIGPRVTVRRGGEPDPDGRCVVYWMQRSQRALDNPALEIAIEAANRLAKPLVVFFCLLSRHPAAGLRHYVFMMDGLRDTAERLERRHIGFVLKAASGPNPLPGLRRFCAQVRPALVVMDENPLRRSARWRIAAAQALKVPMLSVDADVIVPTALIGREHYAARTIRPRIDEQLGRFLAPMRNRAVRIRWQAPAGLNSLPPSAETLARLRINGEVQPVAGVGGGTRAAMHILRRFVKERLTDYSHRRNHPELDGTSRLSPYLHFGQIGPLTAALAVLEADAPAEDRAAFLEQLIVRRELAINFVRYNPDYDRLEGCERWALRTLDAHSRDKRPYLYSERQLEQGETHDRLWNAAQRQMVASGWMHGYLRMYWAKKILHWTASPAQACEFAIRLNDRYELDGRDPNGYAGIAWAVGGKHDRPWPPQRPVFGWIRYMSEQSTARKFDSCAYISHWS